MSDSTATRNGVGRGAGFFRVVMIGAILLSCTAFVHANEDEANHKEEVLSLQELLALKSKWPNYAAIQLPMTIEGRLGARSATQLRLRKSEIRFRAKPKQLLPPIAKKTENVLVKGYLVKSGSRYAFVVQSLKTQPSDLEAFRERRLKLPLKKPGPWYEAAKWARGRGTFYDDKALLFASQTAATEAIRLERNGLPAGDGGAVLKLAGKAAEWKLPAKVKQQLTHEAYRLLWASSLKGDKPTFTELQTGLVRDLPGATTTLKDFPAKLARAYSKNPLTTYHQATEEIRPILHRLFYITVMQQQIERTAKSDGSNGDAVAAALENRLPELPARAEFYRRKALQYRFANIAHADRESAVALAAKFRQRKDPKRASETLQRWLKAQETRLRNDGVSGLIRLSDDTMQLLNDREQAMALLKEANRKQPGLEAVTSRMLQFGFRWHGNKWLTAEEFRKLPVDPATKTMRAGQVIPGMSPAEVRRVVAGTPSVIMRSVTHRKMSEVWVYRQPDRSRLLVHFQRKWDEQRTQYKVTKSLAIPK